MSQLAGRAPLPAQKGRKAAMRSLGRWATMLNFCEAPQLHAVQHKVGFGLVQVPEGSSQMPEVGGKL